MAGLLDGRPGCCEPLRLTDEIVQFLRRATENSGVAFACELEQRDGVSLHRPPAERAPVRRSFWPVGDTAQADYERLCRLALARHAGGRLGRGGSSVMRSWRGWRAATLPGRPVKTRAR